MSEDDVEKVRRAYEAWNRDDVEAALALLHVEWRTSGVFPGLEPVYRGHDGVREFWRALKEPWEYFLIHLERVVPEADAVVALLEFEAVGKESGAKVALSYVNVL